MKRRRATAGGASKQIVAEESRGAEALTVFWMLAALATLIAESVAAAITLFTWGSGEDHGDSLVSLLPGVMLFTALVTGALCLTLTPLVLRVRAMPPPRGVAAIAIMIGLSPWLMLAASLIRG